MKGVIIIILSLISISLAAQSERQLIREGNKQYAANKYTDAEVSYRKASNKKSNSFEANFNTANSLYKQGKYAEAATIYDSISKWQSSKTDLAKTYHNLGNSYVKAEKIQDAINAYKKALKLNSKDKDTKENLSYAYKLLKKQQDQQNKDKNKQNQDKNKDKNKQDQQNQDKNNQNNKNDKNKDQQKQQQDQQKQNPNQDQQQKQGGQGDKQQISREAAQQMLEAIQNDEKNVQQRLQEQKNKKTEKVRVLKNW